MSEQKDKRGGGRFWEIAGILRNHNIIAGITPQKMRAIMEDLGPTFVKLGQLLSMRADLLPLAYCQELEKLRSEVKPMPFAEVERVVEASLGRPLAEAFPTFDKKPLGSASIAQVHAALLPGGEKVVVKVQREGIYDRMASDIVLLRKAVKPLKLAPSGDTIDFNMVLDELWNVSQQEMDFLHEADNAQNFAELNREISYVHCPKIYREVSTRQVLVMEYIDGIQIDDCNALKAEEYDPSEICIKLCTNYMKQVLDDGFFHADPHPGNLRVRDGQIVFLDLGMVGKLTPGDQAAFEKALGAVAAKDTDGVVEAVIAITRHTEPIDRKALGFDVRTMLDQYVEMDLGGINIGEVVQELLKVAQKHRLMLPQGITLLGRGISTLEGVAADISPETNLLQIIATRFADRRLRDLDWKKTLTQNAYSIYESVQKSMSTPALVNDALRTALKGDLTLCVETVPSEAQRQEQKKIREQNRRLFLLCTMLIGSCLTTLSDVQPLWLGLPWIAVIGFCTTGLAGIYDLLKRFRNK